MKRKLLKFFLIPFVKLQNHFEERLTKIWNISRLEIALGQRIDSGIVLWGMPELHGSRKIQLGRNLYLYKDIYLETQDTGFIQLSDDIVLSRGVHLVAHAGITIGQGSMIGEYTSLRDANHQYGSGQSVRRSGHRAAPIVIGKNVWIGRGVVILSGVCIGDNAVVGANSVICHDVYADTVVGGIPAKTLKIM